MVRLSHQEHTLTHLTLTLSIHSKQQQWQPYLIYNKQPWEHDWRANLVAISWPTDDDWEVFLPFVTISISVVEVEQDAFLKDSVGMKNWLLEGLGNVGSNHVFDFGSNSFLTWCGTHSYVVIQYLTGIFKEGQLIHA